MAEYVEYRKERTLPEYEQMQILNLFSADEILYVTILFCKFHSIFV